ncbi:Uncharacterised protein [Candidatus Tiddalikarchaeum anstoanum]|nr:Uncharacterised protein [Candidatus Tiddalikarchaeum anstoanum]
MILGNKTQSAIEFLLTYGWAILIIIIIGFVLYSLGFFNPGVDVRRAWDFTYFHIVDWQISGYDSPFLKNTFRIIISNKDPEIINITSIEVYNANGDFCGRAVLRPYEIHLNSGLSNDKETDTGGTIYENCSGTNLAKNKFIIKIGYVKSSGITHTDTGFVEWKYEPYNYNIEFGEWYHSNYTTGVLTFENGSALGSYNSACPAIIPPAGVNFILGGTPLTWDLPVGCSSGQCHGVGDAGRCTINCSYMAHGWLKTTAKAPVETRGQKISLGGSGTCNSALTYSYSGYNCSNEINNYICLNDDLYFYLNQELIYFSGLSYSPFKCDGCAPYDNWCVPPIDITQSPEFNWGSINEIYILVEDWCISGGLGTLQFLT